MRKLGLFEWGVVDRDADEDEYWDDVRWRSREYVGDEDENDDEDEVDNAGERRRIGRKDVVCTDFAVVFVDEWEFELVPSEPRAESVVTGCRWVMITGDLDTDECELLVRRLDGSFFANCVDKCVEDIDPIVFLFRDI